MLFVWLNSLLTLLAVRWTMRFLPDQSRLAQALVAIVLFITIALLSMVAVGSTVGLNTWLLGLLLSLLLVIDLLSPLPRSDLRPAARAKSSDPRDSRVAGAVVGGLLVWLFTRTVLAGPSLGWDDLTYHAAIPGYWIQHGSLAYPPFTYQVYYPLNAELLAAWFMQPVHSDAYAAVAKMVWATLAILGAWMLGKGLGYRRVVLALAVACFFLSPVVYDSNEPFAQTNVAETASILAMLALARLCARSDGGDSTRRSMAPALACGLAGGLALGTKVTALPAVLAVAAFLGHGVARDRRARSTLGTFALGVILTGSFWYLRNWIVTGNPLFPAAVGPFAGPLAGQDAYATTLLSAIVRDGRDPSFWSGLLKLRWNWPIAIGLVSLGGYALAAVAVLRRRERCERAFILLIAAAGLLLAVIYPFAPFSGTINRPDVDLHPYARYLAPTFMLGLVLYPLGAGSGSWLRVSVLAVLAATAGLSPGLPPGVQWLVAGFGASLILASVRYRPARLFSPATVAVSIVLGWSLVAALTPQKTAQADDAFASSRLGPIGAAFQAIDELPDGSRIASISHIPSSHTPYYPLMGRRLQHEAVPIYQNGRARPPLHLVWREEPPGWWWEFRHPRHAVSPARLRSNLEAAEVDYLLISKWQRGLLWPRARRQIQRVVDPRYRIYSDGYSEIWDLRSVAPAP